MTCYMNHCSFTCIAQPWIESCSLPTKKYLTRRQTGVQAASNLYLDPWNNYWYQGWNFLQLEPKDVNTSTQVGCMSQLNISDAKYS